MENNKPFGIIYKATNIVNGKSYVGQTIKDFEKYKNGHIKIALNESDIKRGHRKTFYDAIRKYGKNNFTWEILKECNDKLILNIMETFMVMVHHSHYTENGYNMTWAGESNPIQSPIVRKKISDKAKLRIGDKSTVWGLKRPDLVLRNKATIGKTFIEIYGEDKANDVKNKMHLSGAGKTLSLEHKTNIGIANKGNKRPDLTERNLVRWRKYHENIIG